MGENGGGGCDNRQARWWVLFSFNNIALNLNDICVNGHIFMYEKVWQQY